MRSRPALALLVAFCVLVVIGVVVGLIWTDSRDYWLIALPGFLTGTGTLTLAVITVGLTVADRRRDDERAAADRAETARLVLDERANADRRAEAERAAQREVEDRESERRRGELQRQHAVALMQAVQQIKGSTSWLFARPDREIPRAAADAITQIVTADQITAPLTGEPEIARRVHALAELVGEALEATSEQQWPNTDPPQEQRRRWDVVAYCLYTAIGITEWATYRPISAPGAERPILLRYDGSVWEPPVTVPQGWMQTIQADPLHPAAKGDG